jgi:hypothetical protein
MVVNIVALPLDRIRIEDSAIYVNDVALTGFSTDSVTMVIRDRVRVPPIVPEGHYFVMGEPE